jgi:hypothetical protein
MFSRSVLTREQGQRVGKLLGDAEMNGCRCFQSEDFGSSPLKIQKRRRKNPCLKKPGLVHGKWQDGLCPPRSVFFSSKKEEKMVS